MSGGFVDRHFKTLAPLPAAAFVVVMILFPVIYTLFLSFTNWNLTSGSPLQIVLLRSYGRVFGEPRFLAAVARTFLFTLLAVGVETILGTALAILLRRQFAGKGLVKLLLLLPLVAAPVAIGICWNLFYDPNIGLANYLLRGIGLGGLKWIYDSSTVIPSLAIVDIWQWTPMITLIVMAGLAGLSPEPFESARVDGATDAQILWRVTLPMVLPTIYTAMILRSIDGLKTFDIIYAMTGGGPGYASETLNIMAFKYSFEYFRMGQSSVLLVVLFLIVLLFSLGIVRLQRLSER
ncbi:MAG: carbohydrate ABC transporter permease [Spirochaetia bacterium]